MKVLVWVLPEVIVSMFRKTARQGFMPCSDKLAPVCPHLKLAKSCHGFPGNLVALGTWQTEAQEYWCICPMPLLQIVQLTGTHRRPNLSMTVTLNCDDDGPDKSLSSSGGIFIKRVEGLPWICLGLLRQIVVISNLVRWVTSNGC